MFNLSISRLSFIFLLLASIVLVAQAQDNSVSYITWNDPNENAFSLEVPQGWNIEGGFYRNDAFDERPYVRATSPDGKITINSFDPRIARNFVVPTAPQAQLAGAAEGSVFNNGVTKFPVMRQLSGADFAELYLDNYPEAGSTGITITSKKDSGPSDKDNFGRLTYSGYKNGELMAGAVSARTQNFGYSEWILTHLSSYLAPASQEDFALSVCQHMVDTLKTNPKWLSANTQNQQNIINQRRTNNIAPNPQQQLSSYNTESSYGSSYNTNADELTNTNRCSYACTTCITQTCILSQGHYGPHQCPNGHTWL